VPRLEEGWTSFKEAQDAAVKWSKANDEAGAFVFQFVDRYLGIDYHDWCSEYSYRYTGHQWVSEQMIRWHTDEGFY
jgi:hypothetical protein